MSLAALVILDAQVNMFDNSFPLFRGPDVLEKLGQLITKARSAQVPIIYVQNNGREGDPDVPGSSGWQIHPALAPVASDIVIQKHTPDAFHETPLQRELEVRQVRRLVLAGMQTELCINATCRTAVALGYEVTLVQDAHSTFDGDKLSAAEVITQHNQALGLIARLQPVSEITFP